MYIDCKTRHFALLVSFFFFSGRQRIEWQIFFCFSTRILWRGRSIVWDRYRNRKNIASISAGAIWAADRNRARSVRTSGSALAGRWRKASMELFCPFPSGFCLSIQRGLKQQWENGDDVRYLKLTTFNRKFTSSIFFLSRKIAKHSRGFHLVVVRKGKYYD